MNEAEAARRFGFDGEVVSEVDFAGTSVTAVVRLDRAEVRRREQAGLGAILGLDITSRLANLPVDWPVPWNELDHTTVRLLETAPPGVVDDTGTAVIRRWRPAVTVTGVLLTSGRNWRAGLANVSLFAPDAPRGIVLRQRPRDAQVLCDEASELGGGVLVPGADGRGQLLVEPLRERSYDLGPRHWRLLEIAYQTWRERIYTERAVQLFR